MKLVIGLGNPGSQYEQNRHNVGFRVVDALAKQRGWSWERKGRAMLAHGTMNASGQKVVLVKPLTFMNLSGEVVGELVRWYKLAPEDILVVYDELDLPIGKVRLRPAGSAGGHNGLSNIIRHVHTDKVPRLRVGIGRPGNARMATVDYVLGNPAGDERVQLEIGEGQALDAILLAVEKDVETAMNLINPDPEARQKALERQRQKQEQQKLRLKETQLSQQQSNPAIEIGQNGPSLPDNA